MSKYAQLEALYMIETVQIFLERGWELVGEPTSSTHPDTGQPATCWTMGKPKVELQAVQTEVRDGFE